MSIKFYIRKISTMLLHPNGAQEARLLNYTDYGATYSICYDVGVCVCRLISYLLVLETE